MQLEQEYEEKQMVIHEKHDLEGLIATLCDQVGGTSLEMIFSFSFSAEFAKLGDPSHLPGGPQRF